MIEKLKDYCDGKIDLINQLNIILKDMSRDWYSDVGHYIYDTFNGKLPHSLILFKDTIGNSKSLISKVPKFGKQLERTYSSLCIFFITGSLDDKSLRKMFGEPIYHNEFGEGFHNEDEDDETPVITHHFASYFVTVNEHPIHIGYDHRGTSVEVPSSLTQLEVCDIIKSLVDIYKQKVK